MLAAYLSPMYTKSCANSVYSAVRWSKHSKFSQNRIFSITVIGVDKMCIGGLRNSVPCVVKAVWARVLSCLETTRCHCTFVIMSTKRTPLKSDSTPNGNSAELMLQLGEQRIAIIKQQIEEATRKHHEQIQRWEGELEALMQAQAPLRAWMAEWSDGKMPTVTQPAPSVQPSVKGASGPGRSRKRSKRRLRGDLERKVLLALAELDQADTATLTRELGYPESVTKDVSSKLSRIEAKGLIQKVMEGRRAVWELRTSEPTIEPPSTPTLLTTGAAPIVFYPLQLPMTSDHELPYPKPGSYVEKVQWGMKVLGGETDKPALEGLLLNTDPDLSIRNLRPAISTMIRLGQLEKVQTGPAPTDYILRFGTVAGAKEHVSEEQ